QLLSESQYLADAISEKAMQLADVTETNTTSSAANLPLERPKPKVVDTTALPLQVTVRPKPSLTELRATQPETSHVVPVESMLFRLPPPALLNPISPAQTAETVSLRSIIENE